MKEKICGVYAWEAINQNSSRFGGKYIGQSEDILGRKDGFISKLRHNHNKNPRMQSYFNKYGEDGLKHYILMECSKKELNFWEKYFIKIFSARDYFNDTDGGDQPPKKIKGGVLQNMKTGEIVKFKSIKEFSDKNNLTATAISDVLNGKYNYTNYWFCPLNFWRPTWYEIVSPEGKHEKFLSQDLYFFAKENGLNPSNLWCLVNGVYQSLKGWKRIDYKEPKLGKEFILTSPNGEKISGQNISDFCRKNNLQIIAIWKVLSRQRISHKGWMAYPPKLNLKFARNIKLINPIGENVEYFGSFKEFGEKYKLNPGSLSSLCNGKLKTLKGWKVA